ncbi:MAG: hypothetical protein P8X90_02650 [Desulfobacterales bacterium]
MPSDKRAKIEFLIVIVLALVLMTMAYFRFWHKKSITAPERIAAAASQNEPAAMKTTRHRQSDEQVDDQPADVALPSINRDIFRPLKIPSAAGGRTKKNNPAKPKPTPVPDFKLGGTIVSGGESIAIINDRFLHTGDTIAAFKVVRIEKNKVQLVSGTKNIELKMINIE